MTILKICSPTALLHVLGAVGIIICVSDHASAQGSFLKNLQPTAPAATQPPSASQPSPPAASVAPATAPVFGPAPSTLAPSPAPTPQSQALISGSVDSYSPAGWPIIAGQTLPLFGIDGIAPLYRAAFVGWIKRLGNQLSCAKSGDVAYICHTPQHFDIAKGAISNGAARTTAEAPPAYHDAEQRARSLRRGVWH